MGLLDKNATLAVAGRQLGADILADLKTSLAEEWDAISEEDKALAKSVAVDLGTLLALQAVGAPVMSEIRHARAALANMGYVRAKAVDRAIWAAVGKVAATLAKGLLAAL